LDLVHPVATTATQTASSTYLKQALMGLTSSTAISAGIMPLSGKRDKVLLVFACRDIF
jgi:hypothetical protein